VTLPVLFTRNLILRAPEAQDFEAWVAFHGDEEVMRFLGGTQVRAVAWRSLCAFAGAWSIRGHSMFSVIERASGRWVGRVGPWEPEGWPRREIAWGLAREFAGLGYAHEAAVAAIDFAVDLLGWTDIAHHIHPENARSIRLAERLGAVNRGPTALPPPLDALMVDNWGQGAEAWRARRQAETAASAG
jgi:RimJ/RimL family protein N-acetyltransferase